jgi:catechol 2,3-dioxygenase
MTELEPDPVDGAEPAMPGSYGRAPRGYRLPEGTRLGPVHLQIADLNRSLAFYQTALGLQVLRREGPHAVLGPQDSDTALVMLHEHPGASEAPHRGRLGLFHFAILLPDRPSLGRFVRHLEEIGAAAGAADHLVSESLYLQDPDNLGIEVYADRPRSTWRRVGRQLMMATDPLNLPVLERAAGAATWTGMPSGTVIGHVHLHVGGLAAASDFFSEALGFDATVSGLSWRAVLRGEWLPPPPRRQHVTRRRVSDRRHLYLAHAVIAIPSAGASFTYHSRAIRRFILRQEHVWTFAPARSPTVTGSS